MADLSSRLRPLVERFVADLEAVLLSEVLATIDAALGASTRTSPAPASTSVSTKTPKKASTPSRRVRRSVAEIEQTSHRIYEHIRKNPGHRAEVIKASLRLSDKEWLRSIARLLEKGQVTATGEKRSGSYSAE